MQYYTEDTQAIRQLANLITTLNKGMGKAYKHAVREDGSVTVVENGAVVHDSADDWVDGTTFLIEELEVCLAEVHKNATTPVIHKKRADLVSRINTNLAGSGTRYVYDEHGPRLSKYDKFEASIVEVWPGEQIDTALQEEISKYAL